MGECFVSLVLNADIESANDSSLLEKNYQGCFKPLLSFLYAHPEFLLTIGFTGPQLSFYVKKHPESAELLHELVLHKQVEILGGGYYAPLFPLLFPVDRSGQIEKMNSLLRSSVGKRPCGMYLFASAWDTSLVTTLQSCGMEYVLLDSSLVPEKSGRCFPLIASEQGKSVKVLPVSKELNPLENEDGPQWTARIMQFMLCNDVPEPDGRNSRFSRIAAVSFSMEQMSRFVKSPVCISVLQGMETGQGGSISFALPHVYLKSCRKFIPSYIPAGVDRDIACRSFYSSDGKKSSFFAPSVYDHLAAYPQEKHLYERMMHISMLIAQCKGGDKVRKTAASEKLWEAQGGYNYMSLPDGVPSSAEKMQQAYRSLNESERLIREASALFKESLTSFDYDGDGLNDYVCQMEKYSAVVSLNSAQVSELNIIRNGANYAAGLSRLEQFDGCSDLYRRGFFADHLFSSREFELYRQQVPADSALFSSVQFSERKVTVKRKEIQLEARGEFSLGNVPVRLRKNYSFSSSGISVQYILKNEGQPDIDGIFAVELNFAQSRFDRSYSGGQQYSCELIADGNRLSLSASEPFFAGSGISLLQVKDSADKRLFVIEPNEESGLVCSLIPVRRPAGGKTEADCSFVYSVSLCWKISLAAGVETEKTINVAIVPVKKNS